MFTEWIKTVFIVTLVTYGTVRSEVCEDLDSQSCATLLATDPLLCQDPVLASTACPRTCKICISGPVTCFHCPSTVGDYNDCNTTKVCQPQEQCLLSELIPGDPSQDHQYKMQCASESTCNGGFKRRDVSTHCCTEDFCNNPTTHAPTSHKTTTTTPTTTSRTPSVTTKRTTTPPTTTSTTTLKPIISTQVSSCVRDIIIMIEDSRDTSADDPIKTFLHDLVDSIPIGPQDTLISLSLFDNSVDNIWDFYLDQTKSDLQSRIDDLQFQHSTDSVDLEDVSDEVARHFRRHHGTFRPDIPEAVVIIADSSGSSFSSGGDKRRHSKRDSPDPIEGENIIVVNVGTNAIHRGTFTDQATDPMHVVDIEGYPQLPSQLAKIRDLICY